MKNIQIASDIIPPGEFKTGLSACMKKVQETGHPLSSLLTNYLGDGVSTPS
jgi:hypothetical protein